MKAELLLLLDQKCGWCIVLGHVMSRGTNSPRLESYEIGLDEPIGS